MADLPSVKMKKRANLVVMIITFLFAIMVTLNLFKIMVMDSEMYQAEADNNQFGATPIPANRGSIYSADNKILAQSATVYTLYIDPVVFNQRDLDHKEEIIQYLVQHIGVDEEKILKAMGKTQSQYEVLAKQVEKPQKIDTEKFLDEKLITCISFIEDTKRYYPQDSLASAVIGFINADGDGQYGIERTYDEYLAGVDGVTISAKDASGNTMPYKYSKLYEAEDGDSLELTIDSMVQYYVESALDSTVEKFDADYPGCAIVMNAKTGAILAMATSNGFDLNNRAELSEEDRLYLETVPEKDRDTEESRLLEEMWKNKAISYTYEPGSVFKVITGAAALEEKVVSFEDNFECKGSVKVDGVEIKCHIFGSNGAHTDENGNVITTLNFKQALANSCNPAFMQIGFALGAEKFSYYSDAFGMRERTGIDLPNEVGSYYAPLDSENSTASLRNGPMLARSAFGQANTITPIQMITGYTAAINGGYLLQPYVVDKIIDCDGNIVRDTDSIVKRQVVSEHTSALMREALLDNVDVHSGGNAYISGYKIGGKSGTAEKISANAQAKQAELAKKEKDPDYVIQELPMEHCASYCAFAPADDPEIVILVIVDQPDMSIGYYGSKVAAPCVTEMLTNILPYLGYYPEYTEEEQLKMSIRVPDVETMMLNEAISTIEKEGFKVDVRGEGGTVVAQYPTVANSMPKGGTVILYTTADYEQKEVIMPDIKDMSVSQANQTLLDLGLNITIQGSQSEKAFVFSQSIAAGTPVKEGTIVTVQFGVNDSNG